MKARGTGLLITALLLSAVMGLSAQAAGSLDLSPASHAFELVINERLIDTGVASIIAQPDSTLDLTVLSGPLPTGLALATGPALHAEQRGDRHWHIHVSQTPGVYRLTVHDPATGRQLPVNVFVPRPFDPAQQAIHGYRIGHYPGTPRGGRAIYDPPTALLRIGRNDTDKRLSPHFTIGQFLCHQQPRHWPKFALVRRQLVDKLEAILTALHEHGIEADTLAVMSGYRTPYYNAAIGNTTTYSRHLYGGAADIFVDTNHDGRMDDLDGNGSVDIDDAKWLARLITTLDEKHPRLRGGLSAYPATARHGPFVHVDVRGQTVRW